MMMEVTAWQRFRAATIEVALVLGAWAVAAVGFMAILDLHLIPTEGPADRASSLVVGPLLTGTWALLYAVIGHHYDGQAGRGEPMVGFLAGGDRRAWRNVGIVLLGITAAVAGSFVLGQVMTLVGFPVEEQAGILDFIAQARASGAVSSLVLLAGCAVVLAPLAEEWMFRGLLFRRLWHFAGPAQAYGVSSFAFAFIHVNPAGFVVYFWLGIVFAATARATGSIWAAVLVHMANNALALGGLMLE